MDNTILEENREYWSWRAPGYSEINREELQNGRHRRWKECLSGEITAHFPDRASETIRVLTYQNTCAKPLLPFWLFIVMRQ